MKKCRTVNWKHIYSSAQQQLNVWNEPVTVFERSPLPHELFELLLTNTEMELEPFHDSFSEWICRTTKTRDVLIEMRRLP